MEAVRILYDQTVTEKSEMVAATQEIHISQFVEHDSQTIPTTGNMFFGDGHNSIKLIILNHVL